MTRLLPKSLFGQTLLILLAGLIVSHAVGSWIYTADREQAVRAVGGFATAQRIANLTRLVQDTPRESRQRIVAALERSELPRRAFGRASADRDRRWRRDRCARRSRLSWSIGCRSDRRASRACRRRRRTVRRSAPGT